MADVSFSCRAYSKIILHAAKYPHCAVNGVLLAKQKGKGDGKSSELRIEDAFPLFHICLHVSPMAEVALTTVDRMMKHKDMVVAGYYLANEHINDLSRHRPAHRIADKIAEHFSNPILVVVDNKKVTLDMSSNPLRISQFSDGKWKPKEPTDVCYDGGITDTDALQSLLEGEHYRSLVDFDNHLDNIALDWQNRKLNKIIDETVEKYK